MCHSSVLTWAASVFGDLVPVADRTFCEVGSYNVNGTVRPDIEAKGPKSYLGVDMSEGPCVDVVANVADLPGLYPDGFDVVVTTEMLEHVEDWREAMLSLTDLVKVGGHLVLSTRSPGFPYHPYPIDCWRYPVHKMVQILEALGFDVVRCVDDPEAPGVFAIGQRARKPRGRAGALAKLEVPGV